MRISAKILGTVLLFLFVLECLTWYAALREDHRGVLTVSFLNVGQGDAVFIEAPSGRTVLLDGGPDSSVLRQLGSVMPFYARSIDVVIASAETPGKVGGLAGVLLRYRAAAIVRPAAGSDAPEAQSFTEAVAHAEQAGTRFVVSKRGQIIDLGDGAFIETLFPDRDASGMPPSDGCLAVKLVFGKTSFLFACGSPGIETYLAALDGPRLQSSVLFGSGGESELFLGFVAPQFAVIPCGADVASGAFSKLKIKTLDTCEGATFVSDGAQVVRK